MTKDEVAEVTQLRKDLEVTNEMVEQALANKAKANPEPLIKPKRRKEKLPSHEVVCEFCKMPQRRRMPPLLRGTLPDLALKGMKHIYYHRSCLRAVLEEYERQITEIDRTEMAAAAGNAGASSGIGGTGSALGFRTTPSGLVVPA